jgi:hypothetical protein
VLVATGGSGREDVNGALLDSGPALTGLRIVEVTHPMAGEPADMPARACISLPLGRDLSA